MSSDVRVYIDETPPADGTFSLYDEFVDHYVTTVRRLDPGDRFEVTGPGRVVTVVLRDRDPLTVEVQSSRETNPLDHELVVHQAITRKQKFEETVKRGTELGVTKFVPVVSKRTVRVPNNLEKQQRRWRKIATDSARISERDTLPTVEKPRRFDELDPPGTRRTYLADPEGEPPGDLFGEEDASVSFFVGPEGGFTEEEKSRLDEITEARVRLGSRNLRAETATITLAGLWLDQTGNLR